MLDAPTVCVNPHGLGPRASAPSFEAMVDRIEAARAALELPRWIFWGMSGGGWLALLYAHRHPDGLLGIVVESACLSFRARVADPRCLLSPHHDAWRDRLRALDLLPEPGRYVAPEHGLVWDDVDGIGAIYRARGGPALLVVPPPAGEDIKAAVPELLRFDARGWARSIAVPTLVIAGTADPVAPLAHVRAVHAAIAGSTYVEIAGAGHVPLVEHRPEVTAAFEQFRKRAQSPL